MPSTSASAREFLLDPEAFFDRREPSETLPWAFTAVVVVTVAGIAAVFLVGDFIADAVDGPVLVDNPEHPGEAYCSGDIPDYSTYSEADCERPAQLERSPESVVREAILPFAGYVLAGTVLLWAAGTFFFFSLARRAGGTPSLVGTAAVAGWLAVPEFVRLVLYVIAVRVALAGVTISDVGQGGILLDALAPVGPFMYVVTIPVVGWQWFIATGGMASEAEIGNGQAAVVTGVPLALVLLFSIPMAV